MSKSLPYHYLLPHHFISRLVSILCYCRWNWFKNWAIRRFIRVYGVKLEEAENSKIEDFVNLNAFFTRKIRQDLRPLVNGENTLASPVDGCISQFGTIQDSLLLQAKGHSYTLSALLAKQEAVCQPFKNGSFMTLYLAPHDYHRIHMPLEGQLQSMTYVPGRLFSVNQDSVQTVPNLFARNERLICLFNTQAGPMAVILVGAMIVGGMETVWAGRVTPNRHHTPQHWQYPSSKAFVLPKGAELGRFNFGSTVILLFGPKSVQWHDKCAIGATMRFGELLGLTTWPHQATPTNQQESSLPLA